MYKLHTPPCCRTHQQFLELLSESIFVLKSRLGGPQRPSKASLFWRTQQGGGQEGQQSQLKGISLWLQCHLVFMLAASETHLDSWLLMFRDVLIKENNNNDDSDESCDYMGSAYIWIVMYTSTIQDLLGCVHILPYCYWRCCYWKGVLLLKRLINEYRLGVHWCTCCYQKELGTIVADKQTKLLAIRSQVYSPGRYPPVGCLYIRLTWKYNVCGASSFCSSWRVDFRPFCLVTNKDGWTKCCKKLIEFLHGLKPKVFPGGAVGKAVRCQTIS